MLQLLTMLPVICYRDGGSLILGDIQVQAGPGSEQTDLAVDVPVPSNSNDSMLL